MLLDEAHETLLTQPSGGHRRMHMAGSGAVTLYQQYGVTLAGDRNMYAVAVLPEPMTLTVFGLGAALITRSRRWQDTNPAKTNNIGVPSRALSWHIVDFHRAKSSFPSTV